MVEIRHHGRIIYTSKQIHKSKLTYYRENQISIVNSLKNIVWKKYIKIE